MDQKTIEQLPFEEAMKQLDGIVKQLELGNLDLEKAIELHQQATLLYQHCKLRLEQAKMKVEQVIQNDKEVFIAK